MKCKKEFKMRALGDNGSKQSLQTQFPACLLLGPSTKLDTMNVLGPFPLSTSVAEVQCSFFLLLLLLFSFSSSSS